MAELNLTKLDRKQDLNVLLPSLCFSSRSENQDVATNVAHCTQVHNMWPFGPLVILIKSYLQFKGLVHNYTFANEACQLDIILVDRL